MRPESVQRRSLAIASKPEILNVIETVAIVARSLVNGSDCLRHVVQ
jgi:hypothetical protein